MSSTPSHTARFIGLAIIALVLVIALSYLAYERRTRPLPPSPHASGAITEQAASVILKSNEIPAIEADLDALEQELMLIEEQLQ